MSYSPDADKSFDDEHDERDERHAQNDGNNNNNNDSSSNNVAPAGAEGSASLHRRKLWVGGLQDCPREVFRDLCDRYGTVESFDLKSEFGFVVSACSVRVSASTTSTFEGTRLTV
jgi:hypothetical protein